MIKKNNYFLIEYLFISYIFINNFCNNYYLIIIINILMDSFTEIFSFGATVYYLYRLIVDYKNIKKDKKFYDEHKTNYIISFIGVICLMGSFQIFWFTEFYDVHRYIAIFIKIILLVFSLFNQVLISDVDEFLKNENKKKDDDFNEMLYQKSENKMIFKLINRLYLLDIALKLFSKRKSY